MKSCGIFARFSAQSVSSTPMSGRSTASEKPMVSQKSRSLGQIASGVPSTTSQRCVPARSMRIPAFGSTSTSRCEASLGALRSAT